MTDLIDVLTAAGLRTGEVLPRREIHRFGKFHRAVHLYLFNPRNELLLQKRALTVDHYPGVFSISVTGHLNAGEFSAAGVRRELREELGIDPTSLPIDFLFSYFQEAVLNQTYIDRQFNDVYITQTEVNVDKITLDPTEVSEIRFVPFDDFRQMVLAQSPGLAPVYSNECRDLIYFLEGSLTPGSGNVRVV